MCPTYHLWLLEAPLSIARAYLHRQTTLVPLDRPVAAGEIVTWDCVRLDEGSTVVMLRRQQDADAVAR